MVSAAAGDWTFGASILTFAFPMILFIAVGGALLVLYSKPHIVPGHRYQRERRPLVPGVQAPSVDGEQAPAAEAAKTAATPAGVVAGEPVTGPEGK